MLVGLVTLGVCFWRLFSMRSQIDQQRTIQETQRQRRQAEVEAERARKIQDESNATKRRFCVCWMSWVTWQMVI